MTLGQLRPPRIWHPVLMGVIPILSALLGNTREVDWGQVVLPVLVTEAVILVLWLLLARLCKDGAQAALIVSAVVVFFFNFGVLDDAMGPLGEDAPRSAAFVRSLVVLVLGSGVLAVLLGFLLTHARLVWPVTRLLNSFSVLVFLILVGQLALEANRTKTPGPSAARAQAASARLGEGNSPQAGTVVETTTRPPRLPDIYYLILDGYGRGDILKEIYDFDNSAFLDGLRQKGFHVASRSTSNYCQTPLSLACSLNCRYHTALAGSDAGLDVLIGAIHESTVFKTLGKLGYKFVSFRTGFPYTDFPEADVYLAPPATEARPPSAFHSLLLQKTAFRLYREGTYAFGDQPGVEVKDEYGANRKLIRYVFDNLGKAAREPSPKFVFAHVICPHPPFLFGANGEDVSPHQIAFLSSDGSYYRGYYQGVAEYVPGYREQAKYVTKRAAEAIEDIFNHSSSPPIIILQADHGPGSRWNCGSADPEKTDVRERFSILNAYYLPDGGDKGLYEGISPVNSFRLLLNNYFGAHLELLPDRSYLSSAEQPFHFVDVTARVRPLN